MDLAVTRTLAPTRWVQTRIDVQAVSAWVLALALVLYLAIDGGGYAFATHSQIGIAVWWIVVVSAAWNLLPVTRLTRAAIGTLGFFGAFAAWTAIGITWSISSGRSFQDLALVTCYLGILVLAVSIHRERGEAVRHTLGAVATAIVVVALLALTSRLWPHLFPASQQTGQFLTGARARLSWPLNYWNALAALMAIGVPLLLALATSARTLKAQATATAAIPIVALCDALTLSRGGRDRGCYRAGRIHHTGAGSDPEAGHRGRRRCRKCRHRLRWAAPPRGAAGPHQRHRAPPGIHPGGCDRPGPVRGWRLSSSASGS